MKKLLAILLILSTGLTYGQAWVWPDVLRAFNQTTGAPGIRTTALYAAQRINDSTAKVLRLEFKKADTALYNTLPVISKEALGIVTTLPAVVKSLEDKIKPVQALAVDTSWKDIIAAQAKAIAALEFKVANPDVSWTLAVASQQKLIEAQAKLITDLAAQLSELKLWADKVKLINFK